MLRVGENILRSEPALSSSRSRNSISIVGSRRAKYSIPVSFEWARIAGANNFSVISGLALGCDTAAHLGCLEVGGHTVAVMPCGSNFIAPSSNRPLAKKILESGGSLVSEYSPDTPPRPFRFVERNRVIASLSQSVIVMEAETKSGTMHTARFALEQKKSLACYVPARGSLSSGCRSLIENYGATPLRNAADLVSFLETLSNVPVGGGEGGWHV